MFLGKRVLMTFCLIWFPIADAISQTFSPESDKMFWQISSAILENNLLTLWHSGSDFHLPMSLWCITAFLIILTPQMAYAWWHHQMETFYAFLRLCEGNPLVTGGFPSQMPVTQSIDVFFDLHLDKLLSKQSRHQWFEMPLHSLWFHHNVNWTR